MRMNGGKALMDRHVPATLTEPAQRGYDESKTLMDCWYGKDRLHYAITPRLSASSTPDQLAAAGALWGEYPSTYVQSHVAETVPGNAWVAELYPDRAGYLDVYDHFGLIDERSLYGHGIYLNEAEWQRIAETGIAITHCPTFNQFLDSGLLYIAGRRSPAGRSGSGWLTIPEPGPVFPCFGSWRPPTLSRGWVAGG